MIIFARLYLSKNMKIKLLSFVFVLQLSLFNAFAKAMPPEGEKPFRSVGYIPSWSYSCYKTLDYTALTHLNIAFCNPDTSGNMRNPFARAGEEVFHDIVKKAHENGVKVIASLGGGGGGANYPALIATEESRVNFCRKIMDFTEKFNLDGIDLDLEEGPNHVLWKHYEAWTKELRKQCTAKNKLLTSAVSTWFSNSISDETFACFDYITLMAYDGPFNNHTSYDLAEEMIVHYQNVRNIDADKIVLGIPFYGHRDNKYNPVGYKDILKSFPQAWSDDYTENISYNGISTVKRKCELAKQYGGVMVWELSYDVEGDYSLLKAIKESLYDAHTGPRYLTTVSRTWEQYPPQAQKRGFSFHKADTVQMDDDPAFEIVLLFSAHNGHYPYFDLFKNYYVILDNYTRKIKYISDVVITTDREIVLEDRNNDGKYELYRRYFRNGKFSTDKKGNNLSVSWAYDRIEYKSGGAFSSAESGTQK
jgi:GH18 family chitinase